MNMLPKIYRAAAGRTTTGDCIAAFIIGLASGVMLALAI